MDILRNKFDQFYDLIKPRVFKLTEDNPSVAHKLFVNSLKALELSGLAGLVLDNTENDFNSPFFISNAAGFNKDAKISPRIIELLGFQRAVIGTVVYEPHKGNPKPNGKRFVETKSYVNWEKLPCDGAERVASRLERYAGYQIPLTLSLMPTPGKVGVDALLDLENTISAFEYVPNIDRLELNDSCPNVKNNNDKMKHLSHLDAKLDTVRARMSPNQGLYLKVSPDSSESDVDDIVRIAEGYDIAGYVTTNTTAKHNLKYITEKMKQGGASGDAVYEPSKKIQEWFAERVGEDAKLIACGGINSVERMHEKLGIGNCSEIQLFTPLIFEGTGLLRKLRAENI